MTHAATYDEIFAHLGVLPAHITEVTIKVDELERQTGREFPPSAHTDDPAYTWWENDRKRSGSRSWVALGWRKSGRVERDANGRALRVRFRRAEFRQARAPEPRAVDYRARRVAGAPQRSVCCTA